MNINHMNSFHMKISQITVKLNFATNCFTQDCATKISQLVVIHACYQRPHRGMKFLG